MCASFNKSIPRQTTIQHLLDPRRTPAVGWFLQFGSNQLWIRADIGVIVVASNRTPSVTSKSTSEISSNSNRRTFLKVGGIVTAAVVGSAALPGVVSGQSGPPSDSMPTRNLGKTGYKVGIFSPGGQGALDKHNNDGLLRHQTTLKLRDNVMLHRLRLDPLVGQAAAPADPCVTTARGVTPVARCRIRTSTAESFAALRDRLRKNLSSRCKSCPARVHRLLLISQRST
jgi:hypothetical protein